MICSLHVPFSHLRPRKRSASRFPFLIFHFRFSVPLLLACLGLLPTFAGVEIQLPTAKPQADRPYTLTFVSTDDTPFELGEPPAPPRVLWLLPKTSPPPAARQTIQFVALAPGNLQLPAFPVTAAKRTLRPRVPALDVRVNPLPADTVRMDILWNEFPDVPSRLWAGQTVDLECILRVATSRRGSADFALPVTLLDGIHWRMFNHALLGPTRFYPFAGGPAQKQRVKLNDRDAIAQRYKYRFTVTGERVTGIVHATLGHSGYERTVTLPIDIPVETLPPAPADLPGIDSGLVGTWSVTSRVEHAEAQGAPHGLHRITLDIVGRGDTLRLDDLDFSAPGFRNGGHDLDVQNDTTFERWHGVFTQTLVPDGSRPRLPNLAFQYFDTTAGEWRHHALLSSSSSSSSSASSLIAGTSATTNAATAIASSLSASLPFPADYGPATSRISLANLSTSWFVLMGAAPVLALLFMAGLHVARSRAPHRQSRRDTRSLLRALENAPSAAVPDLIDDRLLPLLRQSLDLPPGASANDVAAALPTHADELGGTLRTHQRARYQSTAPTAAALTGPALARLVRASGVLLALLLLTPFLRASEPVPPAWETARAQVIDDNLSAAQATLEAHLDDLPLFDVVPQLHLALATIHHAQGNLGPAAAHIHTARLAQPRDAETKAFQTTIHAELGRPPASILPLRPDEWLWVAAGFWCVLWGLAAIQFAFRLKRTRRWFLIPITLPFLAVLVCCATAALSWQTGAYRNEGYMVAHPIEPDNPSDDPDTVPTPILPIGDIVHADLTDNLDSPRVSLQHPVGASLPRANLQRVW